MLLIYLPINFRILSSPMLHTCFNTPVEIHVHDGRRIDCQPLRAAGLNRILFAPRQRFVESMTETPDHTITCSCPLARNHFEQNFTFQLQFLASSV